MSLEKKGKEKGRTKEQLGVEGEIFVFRKGGKKKR